MLSSFRSLARLSHPVARGAAGALPRRFLSIHEYQAQQLMRDAGINVPGGVDAGSPAEAAAKYEELAAKVGGDSLVLKAQVLAGGRGLGHFDSGLQGGVHFTSSAAETEKLAGQMLGHNLITKQTSAEGKKCNRVYLAEKVDIAKEFYVAILMDRSFNGPVIVASAEGGTSIEDVAEANPDAIIKVPVDINEGLTQDKAAKLVADLGITGPSAQSAIDNLTKLYDLFIKTDMTQAEINPFVTLKNGSTMCADAKFNFDSNAKFRQADVFALEDESQLDPRDVEAGSYDLNYIGLSGNIGCMVNGAGLAMATMDVISLEGGEPANFCDVGGSATSSQIEAAFRIITSDPGVKAMLVNVFGGILRCDMLAQGIVDAAKNLELKVPLIVRLEGTNSDIAKDIMKESGLAIHSASSLDEAAKLAVSLAK